MDSCF